MALTAALAGGLLFAAAPARATISEALSLRTLVERSALIVFATAMDGQASRDPQGRIVTDVRVWVADVWKGDAQPRAVLVVRRLGGILGDVGMRVSGEPALREGRRYVLFLRPSRVASQAYRPVGMSQGVLPVADASGGLMVHPGAGGLRLVQRSPEGQLRAAAPAVASPTLLVELQRQVEAELSVETRGERPRGIVGP